VTRRRRLQVVAVTIALSALAACGTGGGANLDVGRLLEAEAAEPSSPSANPGVNED